MPQTFRKCQQRTVITNCNFGFPLDVAKGFSDTLFKEVVWLDFVFFFRGKFYVMDLCLVPYEGHCLGMHRAAEYDVKSNHASTLTSLAVWSWANHPSFLAFDSPSS